MTTETAPNPRHQALADAFLKKLEEMSCEPAEEFLTLKVTLRHGIARKRRWGQEDEADL